MTGSKTERKEITPGLIFVSQRKGQPDKEITIPPYTEEDEGVICAFILSFTLSDSPTMICSFDGPSPF